MALLDIWVVFWSVSIMVHLAMRCAFCVCSEPENRGTVGFEKGLPHAYVMSKQPPLEGAFCFLGSILLPKTERIAWQSRGTAGAAGSTRDVCVSGQVRSVFNVEYTHVLPIFGSL